MPIGHHRRPFSCKQKKDQLKAKRERKRNAADTSSSDESGKNEESPNKIAQAKAINRQPVRCRSYDPNRFNLHFMKETCDNLKRLKKEASKALKPLNDADLEVDVEDIYRPSSVLDMPTRPNWSYDMTKEQLEEQERKYFNDYLREIFDNYKENELSYFEMNLETWRQLWRVLEISDIILLIVDIRFPALHFSPKFYEHCTQTMQKDVILILNKIDLVPTSLVVAWKHYFATKYPNLHIILFSSSKQIKFRQKRCSNKRCAASDTNESNARLEELEIKAMAAEIQTAYAHRQLYECVKNIVKSNVDLSSWATLTQKLVDKYSTTPTFSSSSKRDATKYEEGSAVVAAAAAEAATATRTSSSSGSKNLILTNEDTQQMNELFHTNVKRNKYENGFVTIGCCGFPNVGKSSLLNSLNGRKVVSVSRTPGHTKHLQTIFLTKTVRLCDCPGLVFPSIMCKPLQILAGIYPIAQLQEPYSAIRYLAERIPVVDILNLKHPTENPNKSNEQDAVATEWSPLDICEAWALKRGYLTAKASRPDTYRAANELLRMALDGRLCLSLRPRGYSSELLHWSAHEETARLNELVASVEALAKKRREAGLVESGGDENDDDVDASSGDNSSSNYVAAEADGSTDKSDSHTDTAVGDMNNKFKILATND